MGILFDDQLSFRFTLHFCSRRKQTTRERIKIPSRNFWEKQWPVYQSWTPHPTPARQTNYTTVYDSKSMRRYGIDGWPLIRSIGKPTYEGCWNQPGETPFPLDSWRTSVLTHTTHLDCRTKFKKCVPEFLNSWEGYGKIVVGMEWLGTSEHTQGVARSTWEMVCANNVGSPFPRRKYFAQKVKATANEVILTLKEIYFLLLRGSLLAIAAAIHE